MGDRYYEGTYIADVEGGRIPTLDTIALPSVDCKVLIPLIVVQIIDEVNDFIVVAVGVSPTDQPALSVSFLATHELGHGATGVEVFGLQLVPCCRGYGRG